MTSIDVEFFGIARSRAGTSRTCVSVRGPHAFLAEIFAALRQQFPDFATACLDGDRLRNGFVASVDGQFFTRDDAVIQAGQSVLIMSADAGG